MKKNTGLGILALGIVGAIGYFTYKNLTSDDTMVSLPGSKSAGLGTGGDPSIIPGAEETSTPIVASDDSVARGIEDTPSASTTGTTDLSDTGVTDMPGASLVDAQKTIRSAVSELFPYIALSGVGSGANALIRKSASSGADSFFARFAPKTVLGGGLKVLSRSIPVVGSAMFASDVLIGKAGGGTIYNTKEEWEAAGSPDGDYYATNNYDFDFLGKSSSPPANKTGYGINDALDSIAGTSGDTWEQTYHGQKRGTSDIGGASNTYKSSSGAQVALAGISAEDYAEYLANKK